MIQDISHVCKIWNEKEKGFWNGKGLFTSAGKIFEPANAKRALRNLLRTYKSRGLDLDDIRVIIYKIKETTIPVVGFTEYLEGKWY